MRLVGEEKTHGVPMVASLKTVQLREGRATLVCAACLRGIMKKRVISSVAATGLSLAVAIIGIQIGGWGYVLALASAALVIPGMLYSWADRLVWGSDLARRMGVPGAHFPAGIGQLIWRSMLLVAAGIALLAFIDPA